MNRILLVTLVALISCKGADGAIGPAGPQGAQGIPGLPGPQGPPGTTKLFYTGQISPQGTGFADLPAVAGTLNQPPVYECYLAWQGSGGQTFWAKTGDPQTDPNGVQTCIIGLTPSATTLRIVIGGGIGGQSYAIVVVY